jgi:hypothetical protein
MSLSAIPDFSPAFFSLFSRYARWYVGRSFHAVRLSLGGLPPETDSDRPMVIFLNHASWWDPMIAVLLAERFWKSRPHYAPIEAAALEKYRFFRKLGFFPVEKHSPRGARQFLQTSLKILDQPGAILWITPEAQFVDPRRRPTDLLPGLSHLARRAPHAVFVPLAIEYPFWQERFPEALCRFGCPVFAFSSPGTRGDAPKNRDPLSICNLQSPVCNPQFPLHSEMATAPGGAVSGETGRTGSRKMKNEEFNSEQAAGRRLPSASLGAALQSCQDELAADAIAQDPTKFKSLIGGRAGVSLVYDLWRRARAAATGKPFSAEHGGSRE